MTDSSVVIVSYKWLSADLGKTCIAVVVVLHYKDAGNGKSLCYSIFWNCYSITITDIWNKKNPVKTQDL